MGRLVVLVGLKKVTRESMAEASATESGGSVEIVRALASAVLWWTTYYSDLENAVGVLDTRRVSVGSIDVN